MLLVLLTQYLSVLIPLERQQLLRKLESAVRDLFDLRPAGIIQMLDLKRPIYRQTAAYGHMGRTDVDLPWEKLDKVDALKAAVEA